jgi:hypothetical protein
MSGTRDRATTRYRRITANAAEADAAMELPNYNRR